MGDVDKINDFESYMTGINRGIQSALLQLKEAGLIIDIEKAEKLFKELKHDAPSSK